MNIGILIIIISVIVLAIFASRKNQMEGAEQNRETEQTEKETFANEDILSYGQVQERKRELIDAIEAATRWKNPSRKKSPPELQMSQDCRGEGWFFSSFIH